MSQSGPCLQLLVTTTTTTKQSRRLLLLLALTRQQQLLMLAQTPWVSQGWSPAGTLTQGLRGCHRQSPALNPLLWPDCGVGQALLVVLVQVLVLQLQQQLVVLHGQMVC